LYLLDEVLQGTNSAERRTAARIVVGHLLRTEAVGAITTHDLRLAATQALAPKAVDVHLREEVVEEGGGRKLHFDYRLRSGPATSRNAILLLEMVGLESDEIGAHDPPDPDD
jgi:DNA mismatch repair ATPase MutS